MDYPAAGRVPSLSIWFRNTPAAIGRFAGGQGGDEIFGATSATSLPYFDSGVKAAIDAP